MADSGLSLEQFVTDDYRIMWGKVGRVGIGATFGALFTGIVSVLLGLADIPLALLTGLTEFLARMVDVLVSLPTVIVRSGFLAALPFVFRQGIAGFGVALLVVLASTYLIAVVVRRVV